MTKLDGRICLVTGASSGLGEHFARLLAAEGARVVLGARRIDRIAALAGEIGQAALAVELDVTDEASLIAAYDQAEARFGPVDTVIANAGVTRPGRSTEVPLEALRAVFDTNLLGVYLTAREGAKRMIAAGSRESGRGRIVMIGSMGAVAMIPGEVAYCASKAAVATMGRNMASEWARMGINVNVLQPGFIDTELAGGWFSSDAGKAQIAGFARKRLQPINSLDETLVYLCSDLSLNMTGATLMLDDGQSL